MKSWIPIEVRKIPIRLHTMPLIVSCSGVRPISCKLGQSVLQKRAFCQAPNLIYIHLSINNLTVTWLKQGSCFRPIYNLHIVSNIIDCLFPSVLWKTLLVNLRSVLISQLTAISILLYWNWSCIYTGQHLLITDELTNTCYVYAYKVMKVMASSYHVTHILMIHLLINNRFYLCDMSQMLLKNLLS